MRLLNLREIEEKYGVNPLASYNIGKQFPQFENFIMHPYTPGYQQTKINQMLAEPEYLVGSSFFGDFFEGFKKGIKGVADVAGPLLPLLVGLGREEHVNGYKLKNKKSKKVKSECESNNESESEEEEEQHELEENVKLKKVKNLTNSMLKANKRLLRNNLIRKIMKDRKVNMIKASQIIKQENLKY
jgi:hypothetical protein